MTKEKKAALLRVLVAVMHTGVLGRISAHAATDPAKGAATQDALTAQVGQLAAPNDLFDSFGQFNNADPYVQHFGDLFVLEEPWFEWTFPTW